jgi:DNA polymerase-3 subunit alpha
VFEVEPVLIPDCYYIDQADARSKIILNKIATGAAHEQSNEQYFRSAGELRDKLRPLFDPERWDVDELFRRMCRNTVVIAQGAEAAYRTDAVFMPRYDMTPDEKAKYGDTHTMFLSLLEEGFSRLVPAEKEAEYRERLDKEIYILESTDNIDYLLVQYDTVNWARRNGILVGCGRGSAGGCLALYLLGITLIDPVKYGLLFERFLLPERAGLYAACTTRIVGRIDSKDSYRIGLENSREILLDRDARLVVRRGDEQIEVYADELREGDDILFDNRDLLFEIDRQS